MRHYLDYAATAAIRPPAVAEAVAEYLTSCGATPGRGGHALALEAGRVALRCRRQLCRLLDLPGDPGRLAFLPNATHALNTALMGLLGPGDVVVVSDYDHNAVLRPAHRLARERGVEVRTLPGSSDGAFDLEALEALLDGARLLVVNGASNVLGTVAPVAALAERAHAAGALVLVDAAQTAGHVPTTDARDGADLIAFTGHKGLLGPQGVGGLWVREGLEVAPTFLGGGGDSLSTEPPTAMPDRLEAGTVNGPGLAGLLAGVAYLLERGVARVHAHEVALRDRLADGLAAVPGVTVLSTRDPGGVGIVTVTHAGVDPATLAARLDREFGVMTRHGLHCAPGVHRMLGTEATGAVRLSVGWATTPGDVDAAVEAVEAITRGRAVAVP